MIVLGAGGHAIEILDVLLAKGYGGNIIFFDDTQKGPTNILGKYLVLDSFLSLERQMASDQHFVIGVGDPQLRFTFYNKVRSIGGVHCGLRSDKALVSSNVGNVADADIFPFCFVGPKVNIGTGSLINARASLHHETEVGNFTVISPSATVLGSAIIGDFCFIGAGAVILPKIKVGSHVVVGAGSIVTKNIPDNAIVFGVPGEVKGKVEPIDLM